MLQFEETNKVAGLGLHTGLNVGLSVTASFVPAAPHLSAARTDGAPVEHLRRIRVEDKRIINGKTDVNQLVPFKYKWAWDKYLSGCANHWMPQEVNMQRDIELWKNPNGLTDDERHTRSPGEEQQAKPPAR